MQSILRSIIRDYVFYLLCMLNTCKQFLGGKESIGRIDKNRLLSSNQIIVIMFVKIFNDIQLINSH